MSNGELLYVKGMNLVSNNLLYFVYNLINVFLFNFVDLILSFQSETEDENVEEDIWDDRKLNDAYDKALKIANAEVAKRVAMSTNTQHSVKNPEKGK